MKIVGRRSWAVAATWREISQISDYTGPGLQPGVKCVKVRAGERRCQLRLKHQTLKGKSISISNINSSSESAFTET